MKEAPSPAVRRERVDENRRQIAEARLRPEGGEFDELTSLELLCECGRAECSELIEIEPALYEEAHGEPRTHVAAPNHLDHAIERRSKISLGREQWWKVFAPRPERREPLDLETLKLQRESLAARVEAHRLDLNSLVSQVSTATASAALILGVFGAVMPEGESLLSVLFLIALVPFSAIVFLATTSALDVSHEIEKEMNPLKRSFAEIGERLRELEEQPEWEDRLTIATYEQLQRRYEAIEDAAGYPLPTVLLSPEEWLLFELDRLLFLEEAVDYVLKKARGKREWATFLLGALVVYLGLAAGITALA